MLSPSLYLLVMLLVAAMLGGVIGSSLTRLRDRSRWLADVEDVERRYQATQQQSSEYIDELEASLVRERDAVARVRSRESTHKSRLDALKSHALLLTHRIDDLLEEQRSTEERQIHLERRFIALRDEFEMAARDRVIALPADLSSSSNPEYPVAKDSDKLNVPLLNRRASVVEELLPLGEDIPVLSESDLPESLDTEELEAIFDEV